MTNHRPHSCIIVDDDQTFILILENYISQIPKLSLTSSFTDPFLAIEKIEKFELIDFLFLDVEMKLSGIDVAKRLRGKVKYLIFVTAYERYALEAFNVNCDQYLVKPITFPKFLTTVNELIMRNHRQSNLEQFNL